MSTRHAIRPMPGDRIIKAIVDRDTARCVGNGTQPANPAEFTAVRGAGHRDDDFYDCEPYGNDLSAWDDPRLDPEWSR